MTALEFTIFDLDFPAGNKAKTATLVTGETQAMLVDAGFTRADGHRLAAAVLDSGKSLTTVYISHGDPDFYFGAEVLADAFPQARFVATAPVIEHIRHSYEGKLQAWAASGANLPTRLIDLEVLDGDIDLEGHRFELRGGAAGLADRHYLWQAEQRAVLGGVLVFSGQHVWTADTGDAARAVWRDVLDEIEGLDPELVVPGHRAPGAPATVEAVRYTREYLEEFEDVLETAADGAAVTAELVRRHPDAELLVAAQIGGKVAKGEMAWG
ncbi:MBL fold metallo-hydrolase [Myceligenerans pegani]|uniref:MBL fold metallo-hydrolase n=1 Tax=Myceligenerans pegani TaxID=2776917 RepID=A0ABR9MT98_9MICO|nr:MBL fold metallo-hydrolase [Myceligenerans sp. TRM 65318]MBE1874610.1 MBL fold metallo-hydrolase [Myceligenerans sp. TRM 65318]MBE3016881.1 MBL fold metallo-hydrolase [Myceligenerans sp. TRM 65318]